jgi:hypothetical protein
MELYGNPPVFPKEEEAPKEPVVQEAKKAVDPLAFHSKKVIYKILLTST